MGYIIGIESTTPTWGNLREVVLNFDVPPDPANPTVFGDYNREYPAGANYLKTIEGNGFIRVRTEAGGPYIDFSEQTAPIEDYFIAGGFVEPYPEDMVGRTVETSTSSFTLIIDAFDIGQTAGLGGTSPVTEMEWFENLT